MHERTRRVMRAVKRKVQALIEKENRHCGSDLGLREAADAKVDLEYFIRDEVEGLVKEIEAIKRADMVNRGPG